MFSLWLPKEDPEICSKTIVLNGWLWWEEKKFPRSHGFSWHIKSTCRVLNTEVYPKSKVMSFPDMTHVPPSPRKAWKKTLSKWKTGKEWRVRRVENLYWKSQRFLMEPLEVLVVVAQSWAKGASFKNQFVLSSPTLWPKFLFLISNKPDSLSVAKGSFSEERVGNSTGLGESRSHQVNSVCDSKWNSLGSHVHHSWNERSACKTKDPSVSQTSNLRLQEETALQAFMPLHWTTPPPLNITSPPKEICDCCHFCR